MKFKQHKLMYIITHYIVLYSKTVGLTILCHFSDFSSMYFLTAAIFGNEISP